MITHYSFPGSWGLESISPFCQKVEAYLRLQELEHRTVSGNPRSSPYGKLPTVKLEDGTVVADSSAILAELERRSSAPMDGWLDDRARAVGHVALRAAEEHLYFALVFQRWQHADGWAVYRDLVASFVPGPVGGVVAPVLRRGVKKMLHAQGIGRMPAEVVWDRAGRDIDAIAGILGEKEWLLGDRPSTFDCAVWGQLHVLAATPVDGPMKERALGHANLVAWIDRLAARVDQPRVRG